VDVSCCVVDVGCDSSLMECGTVVYMEGMDDVLAHCPPSSVMSSVICWLVSMYVPNAGLLYCFD
jgi:hypothetical protein